MSVYEETQKAITEAKKLGLITGADGGAVSALMHIAKEIDSLEAGVNAAGKLDNVSVPTYLKYADALGLTPTSRRRMQAVAQKAALAKKTTTNSDEEAEGDSKLAGLRAVAGRK